MVNEDTLVAVLFVFALLHSSFPWESICHEEIIVRLRKVKKKIKHCLHYKASNHHHQHLSACNGLVIVITPLNMTSLTRRLINNVKRFEDFKNNNTMIIHYLIELQKTFFFVISF